jgi:hypothetical protein
LREKLVEVSQKLVDFEEEKQKEKEEIKDLVEFTIVKNDNLQNKVESIRKEIE